MPFVSWRAGRLVVRRRVLNQPICSYGRDPIGTRRLRSRQAGFQVHKGQSSSMGFPTRLDLQLV